MGKSVFFCGVQGSIEDSEGNRRRCELTLAAMDVEWGKSDSDWGYVRDKAPGWLSQQQVYCMLTKFGPLDIFRSVKGVVSFKVTKQRASVKLLDNQVSASLLSAEDLLECQVVLPEGSRRLDRIAYLKRLLERN